MIASRHAAEPENQDASHVVICGAGFAGLSAISRLTRAGLRVTLVDGHLYSTFQPLLYQVATAGLNPGDVAYPAGGFAGPAVTGATPSPPRRKACTRESVLHNTPSLYDGA
jgi:glycine/D-amino acid oxidase-like deaminating enzyme